MPIQFPRPTGPTRSVIESQWLRRMTKAFDAVPAPNMGRPGLPLQSWQPGGAQGFSLNPGTGVSPKRAVNLRELGRMYRDPTTTAIINPVAVRIELFDATVSAQRIYGYANRELVGVTRDSNGAILVSCRVELFQTGGDIPTATTTSDSVTGAFTFSNPGSGPFYIVAYKTGSPDVAGTTINTLTTTAA